MMDDTTSSENAESTDGDSDGRSFRRRTILKGAGLAGLSATALSALTSSETGAEIPAINAYQTDGTSLLSQPRSAVRRVTAEAGSESRSNAARATALDTNSLVSNSLESGEADWYAFEATAGDGVGIDVERAASGGVMTALLYGPSGDFLNMAYVGSRSSVQVLAVARASGTHYVQLVDSIAGDGQYSLTAKDGVSFETTTSTVERIWLEAESAADGSHFAPFVVESDPDASEDSYIEVPLEGRQADSPPDEGHANYSFDVGQDDEYAIWGRCIAPDGDANSFWMSVDGGSEHEWWVDRESDGGNADWQWFPVNDRESGTYPVTYQLEAGAHTLSVKWREDGTKLDRLVVTNDADFTPTGTGGDSTKQAPYGGGNAIPGTVQAEDYDTGGEGVAYHDTDETNHGGAYRNDGVDVQPADGGGYNIGWLEDGEWLEYTVDVEAGTYDVNVRVASPSDDRQLRVLVDDTVLGTLDIPNTGDWQNWATVTLPDVSLAGGSERVLRLEIVGGEFNVDWVAFVSTDETTSTSTTTDTPTPTPTETSGGAGTVSGERKTWHRVAVTFDGPATSEGADPNPFTDYRLDVTFTGPSGQVYNVPGHYAADGDAAETSATSGSAWRAYFAPDEPGDWSYEASFVEGADVAVGGGGTATAFDGAAGTFTVGETDRSGRDLRGKGRLEYVGEHYLRFAETGEYFLKNGADSPENFLGYYQFDQTESLGGGSPPTPSNLHEFAPHESDWSSGDPTWQGGKGKGIVGAVNYLAEQGLNSVYALTYNIDDGDGQDVWPWTESDRDAKRRFDVSKLDQWEIVFRHLTRNGFNLHLVLQERENDTVINRGDLGPERKLYYRELISRFGHHPAITWNLGEETDLDTSQIENQSAFFEATDPYEHQVVIHTRGGAHDDVYEPLLGNPDFDGPSIQTANNPETNEYPIRWRQKSAEAGRPWPVNLDEINDYRVGVPCDGNEVRGYTQDDLRRRSLWPGYQGGAAGLEWYFGTETCQNDRELEDFRTRANWWDWTRHAHEFYVDNVAFERGAADTDALGDASGYVFSDPGTFYVVYLENGADNATLDTTSDEYTLRWYDPRTGQFEGDARTLDGGSGTDLGAVPSAIDDDATALLTR